ncbi:MAG: N-acetyl-gamma-glutamyl-phosphate reductase [Defluviicoccus sp.]|nr:N-acetyl-gamma-glutamyl-phosphate reductase [Defluviicoccus sp.]MDG4593329.1 N-acetyl-gamma-glutamyl-phosphate reductase [Defluviicoccus sp.]MDS4071646.1 N-acetyl-gamma-glutamyl-phosphate reductase [Defluviicoccus sp.]
MDTKPLRVAIVGASGYTGAELVRLLADHPGVALVALTGDRKAGQTLGEVFPHLAQGAGGRFPDRLVSTDQVAWSEVDVAFLGLPHGAAQELCLGLPPSVRVIDLSPDFRFADPAVYTQWYGLPHKAPELQAQAVYGLTEFARDRLKDARIIACPGCYPTSIQLPLVPLLEARLIDPGDIVIDAKSGVSGAGRAAKEGSLFAEVAEGVHAYGVAQHRHAPEIEQGLSRAAGQALRVNFTPHLMPMNRGILSSIYVRMTKGTDADRLRTTLAERYASEPFVRVLDAGAVPATRHVRGSNHCLISVFADRIAGRAIVFSVIDNLVKGASGQAIQNMNVIAGLAETTGLSQRPLFP